MTARLPMYYGKNRNEFQPEDPRGIINFWFFMKRLASKTNKNFSKHTYGLPKKISANIFKIKKYIHRYLTSIFPASITCYKVIVYKKKLNCHSTKKIDLHLLYRIGRKKIVGKKWHESCKKTFKHKVAGIICQKNMRIKVSLGFKVEN